MKTRKLNFLVISFLMIFVVSGCAGIQITRSSDFDKAVLKSKRIFFEKIGKIDQYPDNVDGFVNLLWTNDAEKRKVVENSLDKLTDQLKTYGLIIVEDQNESDVIARLEIKSVRFDPIGGWITDGAALLFIERKSNKEIGKVYSGDALITPSLQKTFERLLDGTLEFWGVSL